MTYFSNIVVSNKSIITLKLSFPTLDQIGGVPLSFSEVTFPPGKHSGRILGELPWIHVDVITNMIIFVPSVGIKVRGKISKVSPTHISLLVFSLFNASLCAETLQTKFYYSHNSSSW